MPVSRWRRRRRSGSNHRNWLIERFFLIIFFPLLNFSGLVLVRMKPVTVIIQVAAVVVVVLLSYYYVGRPLYFDSLVRAQDAASQASPGRSDFFPLPLFLGLPFLAPDSGSCWEWFSIFFVAHSALRAWESWEPFSWDFPPTCCRSSPPVVLVKLARIFFFLGTWFLWWSRFCRMPGTCGSVCAQDFVGWFEALISTSLLQCNWDLLMWDSKLSGAEISPGAKLCLVCVSRVCVCLRICFESGELNGVEVAVSWVWVGRGGVGFVKIVAPKWELSFKMNFWCAGDRGQRTGGGNGEEKGGEAATQKVLIHSFWMNMKGFGYNCASWFFSSSSCWKVMMLVPADRPTNSNELKLLDWSKCAWVFSKFFFLEFWPPWSILRRAFSWSTYCSACSLVMTSQSLFYKYGYLPIF